MQHLTWVQMNSEVMQVMRSMKMKMKKRTRMRFQRSFHLEMEGKNCCPGHSSYIEMQGKFLL